MALIKCTECKLQISDKATACPSCGAKLPRFKWWLWIPLALVIAFFAVGAMTPQYKTHARELREACEVMIGAAKHRQPECDRIYNDAITRGQAGR